MKVFQYYDRINLPSFNMALYPAPEELPGYWITARMVGRFNIFNWTSDINSLQMLFGDFFSALFPEQLVEGLKGL